MIDRATNSDTSGGLNWTQIIVGLLTLTGVVVTTVYATRETSQKLKLVSRPITFIGRVIDDSGKAISGADGLAMQDETVGQAFRTDNYGQFQVNLPSESNALRIIVNAQGFASAEIQANVHRTGSEEIVLKRSAPSHPLNTSSRDWQPRDQFARHSISPASAAVPVKIPDIAVPSTPSLVVRRIGPVTLLVYDYPNEGNICKGIFKHLSGNSWIEQTRNTGGCNSVLFNFDQVNADGDYITLWDKSRNQGVRLPVGGDGYEEVSTSPSGPWRILHRVFPTTESPF